MGLINAAIIGAGLMGRWHAHSARRAGGRIALVMDHDAGRAHTLAARHSGALVTNELDPARIAREATVAHVCTPIGTHETIIGRLLDAGVSVLAEKPLTDDAASTARLLELARERGVRLCPVHQMPFQDGVRRLLDELSSIGDVLHADFTACTAGAGQGSEEEHDGLIADVLPHPLSLFRPLLTRPVATLEWATLHPRAGELRATAVAGRATVSITISTHGRPTTNKLHVIGAHGTFDADLYHGFAVLSRGRVSRSGKVLQPFADAADTFARAGANLANRAVHMEPAYPGLTSLVSAFYAAVRDGTAAPISGEETLDIARARDGFLSTMGLA